MGWDGQKKWKKNTLHMFKKLFNFNSHTCKSIGTLIVETPMSSEILLIQVITGNFQMELLSSLNKSRKLIF